MRAERRPLVVIAETVEGTALEMLVQNHVNGTFQNVAIKARRSSGEQAYRPAGGHGGALRREGAQQELVVRAGADDRCAPRARGAGARDRLRHHDHRRRWQPARPSSCGSPSCARSWNVSIGDDEDFLAERIARLSGKAAIIWVGAPTNAEAKEARDRVDSLLQATRAVIARGSSPVAASTAARRAALDEAGRRQRRLPHRRGDRAWGAHRACEPDRLDVAGYNGDQVVKQVTAMAADDGFDALQGRDGNMVQMGDHRSPRVVRSALQNGASVARADPHHRLAGGRGSDARQQGADDGVGPSRPGIPQPSPHLSTPQSLGLGPSVG